MRVNFYLLRKSSDSKTGIICSVSFNNNRIKFCINESVHPKHWNFKNGRARNTSSFSESMAFNYKLDLIVRKLNKYSLDSFNNDNRILSKLMVERFIRDEILHEAKKYSLYDFYGEFINNTVLGNRVNSKGKVIRPEAAKYYKRALKILQEYKSLLNFDDITLGTLSSKPGRLLQMSLRYELNF